MKTQDDTSVLQKTHSFHLYFSSPEFSRGSDSTKVTTEHCSLVLCGELYSPGTNR